MRRWLSAEMTESRLFHQEEVNERIERFSERLQLTAAPITSSPNRSLIVSGSIEDSLWQNIQAPMQECLCRAHSTLAARNLGIWYFRQGWRSSISAPSQPTCYTVSLIESLAFGKQNDRLWPAWERLSLSLKS